jgi:CheY-like chemotaxis protein
VEKAQEVHPDLVVLDLSMPVMNGLEAARALKVTMPSLPLLMFTNHIGSVMEDEAKALALRLSYQRPNPLCSFMPTRY